LSNLITSVLRTYPELCYFQGYHDVATVLLLALGEPDSRPALARLSLLRIRDFMLPTLTGAVIQLHLVPALLRQSDPALASYLPPDPFYALSATLTLFSHLVGDYPSIARTFDFLLATPASAPVYLYVAAIRLRRHELEELDPHDHDMLHFTLTKMPQDMDFDALVRDAQGLLTAHPPDSLGSAWKTIPGASVLRTATSAESVRNQSLEEAEKWREQQVIHSKSLERREKMLRNAKLLIRKYRRPLSFTGSALAIALLAVVLARVGEGRLGGILSSVWRTLGGFTL
jgi:TBC1 domain family member 20